MGGADFGSGDSMDGPDTGDATGREVGQEVGWQDTVRFRLPPGWSIDVDEHEGHPVAVFRPPAPSGGVLRLVTDRKPPRPEDAGVDAVLREMALRFVRPDDPRAGDRTVEDRFAAGRTDGLIAQAVMVTEEDGRRETHYLWLIGAERAGQAAVAMFSFALPAILDGDESCSATLGMIDAAIRAAVLV